MEAVLDGLLDIGLPSIIQRRLSLPHREIARPSYLAEDVWICSDNVAQGTKTFRPHEYDRGVQRVEYDTNDGIMSVGEWVDAPEFL